MGVALANFNLSRIGAFLQSLHLSNRGLSFIMERDGTLVATSTTARPFLTGHQAITRVRAMDSEDARVSVVSRAFFAKASSPTQAEHFDVVIDDETHFIEAKRLRDERGLDWIIVVVLPRSDFMVRIDENARTRVVFALLSLTLAALAGPIALRMLTRPIEDMSTAASAIAGGQLEQHVVVPWTKELAKLASAFNAMARQLVASLADLDRQNRTLEETNKAIARFVHYSFLRVLGKTSVQDVERGEHAGLMVAVMCIDIRGFTTLAEGLGAAGTFGLINRYLAVVEPEIHRPGGHIAQYLGWHPGALSARLRRCRHSVHRRAPRGRRAQRGASSRGHAADSHRHRYQLWDAHGRHHRRRRAARRRRGR